MTVAAQKLTLKPYHPHFWATVAQILVNNRCAGLNLPIKLAGLVDRRFDFSTLGKRLELLGGHATEQAEIF